LVIEQDARKFVGRDIFMATNRPHQGFNRESVQVEIGTAPVGKKGAKR
jgi:hypothetical protein